MKSADLIGHSKFLPWQQLDGCSVTISFLSAKGAACEISTHPRGEDPRTFLGLHLSCLPFGMKRHIAICHCNTTARLGLCDESGQGHVHKMLPYSCIVACISIGVTNSEMH